MEGTLGRMAQKIDQCFGWSSVVLSERSTATLVDVTGVGKPTVFEKDESRSMRMSQENRGLREWRRTATGSDVGLGS